MEAARLIGDALAATNRVAMGDGKRLDLAEKYWAAAIALWPVLESRFAKAQHPLSGAALEAAKAGLTLASELAVAYKHLLASEADKRLSLGGQRLLLALIHRCMQCTGRILVNSYLSYAPVPARTWHDAHLVYAFARERNLHLVPLSSEQPDHTAERLTVQSLLLALANPYGFLPGQLALVLRYVQEHAHWAKLTDVAPVHRMAKAVAIVPVGHDFPPFSANKGGSIDGSKLFLLTFDLAFQIQEQLRALEAGGPLPEGVGRDSGIARAVHRAAQAAVAPVGHSAGAPVQPPALACPRGHLRGAAGVWQYSRGVHAAVARPPAGLPPMANCQVINHTPAGYALRQTDSAPAALRIGELVALRVEGRTSLQVAMVRWFRNTFKGSGLEFGCELLSENPEAAGAAAEDAAQGALQPAVVLPGGNRRGRRAGAVADHRAGGRVRPRAGDHAAARAAARASRCSPSSSSKVRDSSSTSSCRSVETESRSAVPRLTVAALAALTLLEVLWSVVLAPLPGAQWLAIKALPLAVLFPGVARGARKPRQWLALLTPFYFAEALVRAITEPGRHATRGGHGHGALARGVPRRADAGCGARSRRETGADHAAMLRNVGRRDRSSGGAATGRPGAQTVVVGRRVVTLSAGQECPLRRPHRRHDLRVPTAGS